MKILLKGGTYTIFNSSSDTGENSLSVYLIVLLLS